jgi:uncharacterized protein (DUF427 family)
MGLMYGTGPFSREPAGTFNFDRPPAGSVLYLDPCPKRVRVMLGGEVVADSRDAFLLHESGLQPVYYFPARDVRSELLLPSEHVTRCPKKGEASYYDVRVGERVEEAIAWYYPSVIAGAPAQLAGLIAFYFKRMDRWLEEDEEIRGHPRDPYHRIDVRQSSAVVRVSAGGVLLAESARPRPLFETGLPVRWYLPREDVRVLLRPTDTVTHCPYKGDATYSDALVGDAVLDDLVWSYADPFPGALPIKGLVCFWNERVDLEVDDAGSPGSGAGALPHLQ